MFVKNVILQNPSLDPACAGGGHTLADAPSIFDTSTCGGPDASLLAQQLDGRLELAVSLRMAARVRLAVILSLEEALCDFGTFYFIALQILSAGGNQLYAVSELLCLVERI